MRRAARPPARAGCRGGHATRARPSRLRHGQPLKGEPEHRTVEFKRRQTRTDHTAADFAAPASTSSLRSVSPRESIEDTRVCNSNRNRILKRQSDSLKRRILEHKASSVH
jgi:hypothetical protein